MSESSSDTSPHKETSDTDLTRPSLPEGRIPMILKTYRETIASFKEVATLSGGNPDNLSLDDYLRKARPFVASQILRTDAENKSYKLEQDLQEERRGSSIDELTGLANYKGFKRQLNEVVQKSRTTGRKSVLVLLDLNGLKAINDGPGGHPAGDEYLKKVAEILSSNTRGVDQLAHISDADREQVPFPARWGGDEFGVILESTNYEGVHAWFNRLYPQFVEQNIRFGAGAIEINPENIRTDEDVTSEIKYAWNMADVALYEAKGLSKNPGDKKHCVLLTPEETFTSTQPN